MQGRFTSRSMRRPDRPCLDLSAQLALPPTAGLQEVSDRLFQVTGRKVWVLEDPLMPPWITGFWVAHESRDYVFHRAGLRGCYRRQAIVHEFCHIARQHETADELVLELLDRCPHLAELGPIRHACFRKDLATGNEYEAELMASTFLARSTGADDLLRAVDLDDVERAELLRLENVFRT